MELRFSHEGGLELTSRELNIFQKGLRIFGEIENFSSVGVEAFHDGRDFSGLLNDVFLVDCNFFGGGMLIFFRSLKVFSGD